ncbi:MULTISPECIES: hypothetical protein [unclassified Bradyrhizobium]|uniref:hypothetical protein n=1 Tax=unclassified Bradyrhizobium TaxID=2631580 RepID=UPI002916D888|nr:MULTISPECIES: hypothetical protein [unclassified Bradyrhizobium]
MKSLFDHQRAALVANGKANVTLRDCGLDEQDVPQSLRTRRLDGLQSSLNGRAFPTLA